MISNTSLSAFSSTNLGPSSLGSVSNSGSIAATRIAAGPADARPATKVPPARPDISTAPPNPNLPRGSLLDLSI